MSRPQIILAGAGNELPKINTMVKDMCGSSYKLKLSQYRFRDPGSAVYDETSEEYDIILCLYHGLKCVSSVTGRYNKSDKSMELLSKTAPDYEGLKFNLYIRTIFIYLMCFVRTSINSIYSYSVNPISTYAMYKHYTASNPDLEEYARENNLTPSTFTLEDAKKFHTYFIKKYNTRELAKKEVEDMLEDFTMEELGWSTTEDAIEFIMTTMNNRAITLKLDLKTPGIKQFLLDKLSGIRITCDTRGVGRSTRRKSIRKAIPFNKKKTKKIEYYNYK